MWYNTIWRELEICVKKCSKGINSKMIRFIFAAIVVLIQIIVSIVLQPIGLLIGLFSKKAMRIYAYYFARITLFLVSLPAGIKTTCQGRENIPEGEPVLYVANHRSIVDIFVTWGKNRGQVGYLAKDSLGKIPIFSRWIKMAGGVFVERDNPRQAMKCLKEIIERTKEGESFFVFPEGTRNKNEDPRELLDFKGGAKKIAQKTGCAVVPVAISHSDVYENHSPKFRKENAYVEYLKPIYFKDLDVDTQKNFDSYVREMIKEKIKVDWR